MANTVTKLEKVMEYMHCTNVFTWQQFLGDMKCKYPSTETNYLSMLVKAGYLKKPKRGKYEKVHNPSIQIHYSRLERESKTGKITRGFKTNIFA